MIARPCFDETSSVRECLPLNGLRANELARVVELTGESRQVHRLEEMGLREGCQVRMIRPGKPCVLALNGKRMSVRLNGPTEILVSVEPDTQLMAE